MTPEAFVAFHAFRKNADLTPYLEKIATPTLVIQRRYPDQPPLELEVAARIAQAALVSFDASGPIREVWREEETEAVEQFLGVRQAATSERMLRPGDGEKSPTGVRTAYPNDLTLREVEVLRLIAAGRTNSKISCELVISERTVARHITNIYGKIGARGKADATAYAIRHSLTQD